MIFKNQDAFYSQSGTIRELKAIALIENTDKRGDKGRQNGVDGIRTNVLIWASKYPVLR